MRSRASSTAAFTSRLGAWEAEVETEMFLNQPFDRNILQDNPERASFAGNFDIEPLQISQLYVGRGAATCTGRSAGS